MTTKQITADEIKAAVLSAMQEVSFPVCKTESLRMDRVEAALLRLTEIITGNGDASKGLVVKTDRNEQNISTVLEREKIRSGREWGIWAAIIVYGIIAVLQIAMK